MEVSQSRNSGQNLEAERETEVIEECPLPAFSARFTHSAFLHDSGPSAGRWHCSQ